MDSERDKMTRTAHKKIFVANVDKVTEAQFERIVTTMEAAAASNDEAAVEAVASVVPTFSPWKNGKPDNLSNKAVG